MIYVGVGSSLGDGKENLDRAEKELSKHAIKIVNKSQVIHSDPYGGVATNVFMNAVWAIDTELNPVELLVVFKNVENIVGRVDKQRWDDRIIDLDILAYHDLVVDVPHLTIPHRDLQNRTFVLRPWTEIAPPDYKIPQLGRPEDLLEKLTNGHSDLGSDG